jgi:gamma-glutamyl:cysteine ligase YbdK (ATP-grasp superfamily)
MGLQNVGTRFTSDELRVFIKRLLTDIRALGKMISDGMIETGIRRIGAEQELFLVNAAWRPAPVADEVLGKLSDPHYTNEIALFNLEVNFDPLVLGGGCLSQMEQQIHEMVNLARAAANSCDAEIALTGILPTLRKSDLELINMTPKPRYFALNDALNQLRG